MVNVVKIPLKLSTFSKQIAVRHNSSAVSEAKKVFKKQDVCIRLRLVLHQYILKKEHKNFKYIRITIW